MNIFWLEYRENTKEPDPWESAFSVCDKHVNSQIRESALMLNALYKKGVAKLGHTHLAHPCTRWTLETIGNYLNHCEHAMGLCESYEARYKREHALKEVIQWCMKSWRRVEWHRLDLEMDMDLYRETTPPTALGLETHPERSVLLCGDVVNVYRHYYKSCKSSFAQWNHGPTPTWWETWPSLLKE